MKQVILGGGESGVGAALLAQKMGAEVILMDEGSLKDGYRKELEEADVRFIERSIDEAALMSADEVVKSPGIPEKNTWVKKLRTAGIPIISEVELAYRHKGNSKIVAITGSNGKSTTTSMIYHICRHAGLDCALVGNIGYSIARQVAVDPKEWYIAEISSFQLDDIVTFRPDIALLLNITEDHLDRYEYKFENYIRSKFRIAMNQTSTDHFIYNMDDEVIMNYMNKNEIHSIKHAMSMQQKVEKGAYIANDEMHVNTDKEEFEQSVYDFTLRGKHNQSNTMAASLTSAVIGLRKNSIKEAVQTFQGLEHRMELVATIRGVEFINDSKSTNVNSTWFALEGMTKPVVLILGGVDKGNDYALLNELVLDKVKCIVCLGVDNTRIHEAFGEKVPMYDTASAEEAVQKSYSVAEPGDVVLLSPACASFDLFKNYEDRGAQFRNAVKNL